MSEPSKLQVPNIRASGFIENNCDLVFDYFTVEAKLIEWFVSTAKIGSEVGVPISFCWRNWGVDKLDIEDTGKILAYDRPSHFSFLWMPGNNFTIVDIRITPQEIGALLSLRESGFQPDNDGLTNLMDCSAGWGEVL